MESENNFKESKFKKGLKNIWDLVKFAIIALLIVMPIRMYIAQPFIVSGESMAPTFYNGEYLIVDELSYLMGEPERNDVVIFRYPDDPKRYFIKRIIGMPNEEIIINDGSVTIKNSSYPEGFILKEPYINEIFNTSSSFSTKEKEYFVMGDNRNRSSDSRVWGILPRKLIIGRAYLRLLPFDRITHLPGYYEINK